MRSIEKLLQRAKDRRNIGRAQRRGTVQQNHDERGAWKCEIVTIAQGGTTDESAFFPTQEAAIEYGSGELADGEPLLIFDF